MARGDPQLKVRLSEELLEQIKYSAQQNKRSMNAEIVARLEDYPRITLLETAIKAGEYREEFLQAAIDDLKAKNDELELLNNNLIKDTPNKNQQDEKEIFENTLNSFLEEWSKKILAEDSEKEFLYNMFKRRLNSIKVCALDGLNAIKSDEKIKAINYIEFAIQTIDFVAEQILKDDTTDKPAPMPSDTKDD